MSDAHRSAWLAGAAIALVSTASATGTPTSPLNCPEDLAAINALEKRAAAATNVAEVLDPFAPSAVAADFGAPGWYEGKDAIRKAYEPQLTAVQSHTSKIDEINVLSDGEIACAALRISFAGRLKDQTAFSVSVRELDAFRKVAGKWQLVQQHVSVPVDPKSGDGQMHVTAPASAKLAWAGRPPLEPPVAQSAAKREISAWLDSSATADLDKLVQHYGPDDNVILYDVFIPGELRGLGEIRTFYSSLLSGVAAMKVRVLSLMIETDGRLAAQIDAQEVQIEMKDGTHQTMFVRQSDCLQRVHGSWYSFFEMASYPIDTRNGKAVTTAPQASK